MNTGRRNLVNSVVTSAITTAVGVLAMPSLLQAKTMTRSEEQAAARAAAKMVAEETGEKPHTAAGTIVTLPEQIHLLDGKNLNSHAYDNKVLMLYFWASWCPICKIVGPQLQQFWQSHRNKGIELLSVAVKDATQKTKAAVEQRHYKFPVAMVGDLHLSAALKTRSLPTIMLRSKLGVIVTVEEGDVNPEEIKEFLVHL